VQLFAVLVGLRGYVAVRGEAHKALAYAEQLLQVARQIGDSGFLLQAHMALVVSYYVLGEFSLAQQHSEQGVRLYDPQHHYSHALLYGYDPKMLCLLYSMWSLCVLGYPDQARHRSGEMLTFGRERAHPYSLVNVLVFTNKLYVFRGEEQKILDSLPEAVRLCTEYGIPLYLTINTIFHGWVLLHQGRAAEGVQLIQEALSSLDVIEVHIFRPEWLAYQAEGYAEMGQVESGLAVLTQALEFVERNDERYYEAELYRLKGELLLAQEGSRLQAVDFKEKTEEAEECFLKAIEVARKQQAKSLELRATTSLARLWQQQGKQQEAHEMLAEIYGWFTEGFDTKDLQEAKVLLDSLESSI
jgi:predicted ATPase